MPRMDPHPRAALDALQKDQRPRQGQELQRSAAQRSVMHRTAPYRTAQHSTAQHTPYPGSQLPRGCSPALLPMHSHSPASDMAEPLEF